MKRVMIAIVFLAFGISVAFFDDLADANSTTQLRAPFDVSLWLDVRGLADVKLAWELVVGRLPCWIVAFLTGVLTTGMRGHKKMIPGVCFCIGMVSTSLFPSFSTDILWWEGFGADLWIATILWELIAFPAFFLGMALRLPRSIPQFSIRQIMGITLIISLQLALFLNFRICGSPLIVLGTLSLIAYFANRGQMHKRHLERPTGPPNKLCGPNRIL
jgi:hypothetical protein